LLHRPFDPWEQRIPLDFSGFSGLPLSPQQLLDEFVGLTLLILRDVGGILRFTIQFEAYLLFYGVGFRWWMDVWTKAVSVDR